MMIPDHLREPIYWYLMRPVGRREVDVMLWLAAWTPKKLRYWIVVREAVLVAGNDSSPGDATAGEILKRLDADELDGIGTRLRHAG